MYTIETAVNELSSLKRFREFNLVVQPLFIDEQLATTDFD